jgi:hypothetical protein
MESEGSLLSSQGPTTGPSPEADGPNYVILPKLSSCFGIQNTTMIIYFTTAAV